MKLLSFLALSLVATAPAFAAKKPLATLLKEFDENPSKFMNTLPQKANASGVSFFSNDDIENKDYITVKNKVRPLTGRVGIQGNDRPESLVDNSRNLVRKLSDMDRMKSASLQIQPWSDYYWSLYNGQLAYRYADNKFPGSEDWKANTDYVLKALNSNSAASSLDNLSPAEKYDLIVGDKNKTLTRKAIAEGEGYYRNSGSVETWMGICHGWAPAAFMMDRPKNAIKVVAADGITLVTLYPADIKALASLLWAVSPTQTNFIGGRCDVKDPEMDTNGRVKDSGCFDTNPGAWHMSVVNQIAVAKRSFVLDATYDFEVWNQPVQSYEYAYFNPQTLKPVKTLQEAAVPVAQFSKDKFKKYRDAKTAFVVGVSMDLTYVSETNPTTATRDSQANDALNTVSYQYDLELDAQGNIIGGEWYNNAHPDFLWVPVKDTKASTPGDQLLARNGLNKLWNGKDALPRQVQDVAARNSAGGAPLALIVESLIQLSNSRF